ncbi:hypothetical protein Tco_0320397 [Tanacetum coccineum]
MAALKFAETHNLVAFLSKPEESDRFEQIFWTTVKAKTINGERQLQALVDGKKVIVTELSIRRDLHLDNAEGTDCLPTARIFKELTRICAKTTAWNEFSSTMASAIICSATPTDPTPTTTQPSTSNPKKKQSSRKKRKETEDADETIAEEAANVESVPTHSNDPLLNGEDRLKLNELIEICTNLQKKVLDLEKVKTAQDSLGDQDDASKQGRKIADINVDDDADAEEVEVEKVVSTAEVEVTTASATTTTVDELTLTQTLIEIKANKPKAITTAAITTNAKDKGKEKMVESEKHLKKKDQIMFDKEAKEQGELTIEEKSRLFIELMNKRKKHFTRFRAEGQRRKPPTKAQKRNTMSTYLKSMAGYKHNQLKTKSFEDIQIETRAEESSSKRADTELEQEVAKKQKIDDDQDEAEMKKHMEIVPDDEVSIDAIPLATKPPIIVDWKIIKEGKMGYFQIIRADGSSKRPEEGYERVLWSDLKVMFEHDVESEV